MSDFRSIILQNFTILVFKTIENDTQRRGFELYAKNITLSFVFFFFLFIIALFSSFFTMSETTTNNLYKVLGIPKSSTPEEIKKVGTSYNKLSLIDTL